MKPLLLAAALLLAACGPVYKTSYTMVPPATASGQLCSNNVRAMSDTCFANCAQMARSCRSSGSVGLGFGYGSGIRYGDPVYGVGVGNSTLLDDRDCSPRQCEDNCAAAARAAHLNCGGTITQEVVCTANCPAPPRMQ